MPTIAPAIARKPPRTHGTGCRHGSGNTTCWADRRNHRPRAARWLRVHCNQVRRPIVRKLIAFDEDTFDKLKQLARDRMGTIQELADEAFADLLKKHGIPIDLRDALRKSARIAAEPAKKPAENSRPPKRSRK